MGFYRLNKILSYNNKRFYLILMNRTAGKTFAVKEYCVKRFLEKGEQFAWIKRYKEDIDATVKEYWNDISFKFPEHSFKYKAGVMYIDNKEAGFAYDLNNASRYKGNSKPDIWNMHFDEFLNEDGKYLKDEFNKLVNLYQTIARGGGKRIRAVKCFMTSNTMSLINPYFDAWNMYERLLDVNTENFIMQGTAWVMECGVNEDAKNEILQDDFGKMLLEVNSNYASMALNNKFYQDNLEFVNDKMPNGCKYRCTIIYNNKKFGVWLDRKEHAFYINKKTDPTCLITYSLDVNSHNKDTVYISHSSMFYKAMKESFSMGLIRFSDLQAKNALMLFLNLKSE